MSLGIGEPYDVVIAGGGLAGCTAAMGFSQAGHRVLVVEKDRMPRDKLCGEFLSPEVSDFCGRFGLRERLARAGAREIRRLRATAPGGPVFETTLPRPGMAVSRRTLDAAFFARASEAGAELRDETHVRDIGGSMNEGFVVEFAGGRVRARMALGAYGRRDRLDRRFGRSFLQHPSPYAAFKAHFSGLDLDDRIELHAFSGGYCGLLTEDHGDVNVCWITHVDALKASGGTAEDMIETSLRSNDHLAARLARLRRESEFHATGQLIFRRKTLFEADVCMIGDAAGMIAPVCGDGMAMAIESGELVATLGNRFLAGDIDAATFRKQYRRAWRARFAKRMLFGRLLHSAGVRPGAARAALILARLMPFAARSVIRATRG